MSEKLTEDSIPLLKANGYKQLTDEYVLPDEEEFMARAIAQLEKNSRSYAIVEGETGPCIWVKAPWQLADLSREREVAS